MKRNAVYLLAALAAASLVLALSGNLREQARAGNGEEGETVTVTEPMEQAVAAAVSIRRGEVIRREMLRMESVPAREPAPDSVRRFEDAEGAFAAGEIPAGQRLTQDMLQRPREYVADTSGLSYIVPEGMTALAVRCGGTDGLSGYLARGDTVDLLAPGKAVKAAMEGIEFYEQDSMPAGLVYLAKNVTVLAVGDRDYDRRQRLLEDEGGRASEQEDGAYDCVVLCLDEFSAQIAAEVDRTSAITLTLRHRSGGGTAVTVPELQTVEQSYVYRRPQEG